VGRDFKGRASPLFYIGGILLAFVSRWIAGALYVAVAVMWLVPDLRIEHAVASERDERSGE
jgi:hypothetical protein